MLTLKPEDVHKCFRRALCVSRSWRRDNLLNTDDADKNELCSAKFLHAVCEELSVLPQLQQLQCNVVKVLDQKCAIKNSWKKSGEWLLDATWTSSYPIPNRADSNAITQVHCAIECESNSATKELYTDLSKLLVINSPIKIFASGLNQQNARFCDYMDERVEELEYILNSPQVRAQKNPADWYYVFWPSPKKAKSHSIWDQFGPDDTYHHLNEIHLFHRGCNASRFRKL